MILLLFPSGIMNVHTFSIPRAMPETINVFFFGKIWEIYLIIGFFLIHEMNLVASHFKFVSPI